MTIAFNSHGALVSGTNTTINPAWPAGHGVGDKGILLVCQDGSSAPNLSSAQGFVLFGTANSVSGIRMDAYYCDATSGSMVAPTITVPASTVQMARISTFSGSQSGAPTVVTTSFSVGANAVNTNASSSVVNNCLLMILVSYAAVDGSGNVGAYLSVNSPTDASLTSPQRDSDDDVAGFTLSTGIGQAVGSGLLPTAGSSGTVAWTFTSLSHAYQTITAFLSPNIPAVPAVRPSTLIERLRAPWIKPGMFGPTKQGAVRVDVSPPPPDASPPRPRAGLPLKPWIKPGMFGPIRQGTVHPAGARLARGHARRRQGQRRRARLGFEHAARDPGRLDALRLRRRDRGLSVPPDRWRPQRPR